MNRMKYMPGVVTLSLDNEKCTGCGICLDVCPQEVLRLVESKVEIFDKDACMECGACMQNCPFDAINVRAGVGCAAAFILGNMSFGGGDCCCSTEEDVTCCSPEDSDSNISDC